MRLSPIFDQVISKEDQNKILKYLDYEMERQGLDNLRGQYVEIEGFDGDLECGKADVFINEFDVVLPHSVGEDATAAEIDEIEEIQMPDEKTIYGDVKPFSEEGYPIFIKWCKDNGVTYYGMPKKSFSKIQAYALAKKEGNKKLLMEKF